MSEDEAWGPWIEHTGRGAPNLPEGTHILAQYETPGEIPQKYAGISCDYPSWHWRWKRVGWFRREYRRVCDEPAYAPLIRYRIRKPRALTMLREIAEGIREPENA